MIQCLRSLNLVAIACEVEGDTLTAQWVQINPKAIAAILGTEQELVQPKTENGITMTVMVPKDLSPVHTDVRFPITSLGCRTGEDTPN
jgi:hypothetical protein